MHAWDVKRWRGALCTAVGVLGLALPCVGGGIEAVTSASEDVTLSFVRPGQIAKVLVKEGDAVEAGQLVVQQDDAAELAQLEELRAQADDTVRVRAAEAQLAQKRVDQAKLEQALAKGGAVSQWDVDHAKLYVTIAEMSLELAKFQHAQDMKKYEETRLMVERMRLKSPIAGVVEHLWVRPGESADALAHVIRVVKIKPLWVDVPAPAKEAAGVKLGQAVSVTYRGQDDPVRGTVIHVGAVVDAASETRLVRVEVANTAGRPAGERVTVNLETPGGTATGK